RKVHRRAPRSVTRGTNAALGQAHSCFASHYSTRPASAFLWEGFLCQVYCYKNFGPIKADRRRCSSVHHLRPFHSSWTNPRESDRLFRVYTRERGRERPWCDRHKNAYASFLAA